MAYDDDDTDPSAPAPQRAAPPARAAAPTRAADTRAPRRAAPASAALDPPLRPARPGTSLPPGGLDPPLPPSRPRTRLAGGVLDPPVAPATAAARSGRRPGATAPSTGLPSGSLDPALPPAGAPAPVLERPTRAPVSTRDTLRRAAVVGVVGVVVLAVVARVVGGDDDRARLTRDDERIVADAWRKEGLTRMGGARDDDAALVVGQTVAGFGRMLGERLGGRALRTVVVEAPTVGELFSLPDGTVVVTTGLLSKLSSHAELLALVAHATAHVVLEHTARALAPVAPTLNAAAQAGTSSVVDGTMTPILRAPFSADDEEAADAFAVQAMLQTGWDSAAYERALKLTAAMSADWAGRHGIDDARLQRRGAVESSGRVGDAEYRNGVLVPLGVVSLTPPPSPDAPPIARDEADEEEDARERGTQHGARRRAGTSSDRGSVRHPR